VLHFSTASRQLFHLSGSSEHLYLSVNESQGLGFISLLAFLFTPINDFFLHNRPFSCNAKIFHLMFSLVPHHQLSVQKPILRVFFSPHPPKTSKTLEPAAKGAKTPRLLVPFVVKNCLPIDSACPESSLPSSVNRDTLVSFPRKFACLLPQRIDLVSRLFGRPFCSRYTPIPNLSFHNAVGLVSYAKTQSSEVSHSPVLVALSSPQTHHAIHSSLLFLSS